MKILANENIHGDAVDILRARGHDVIWIRTDMPGADDPDILARAMAEQRVLITFDKDFGYLVFAKGQAASCGVILFRVELLSPSVVAQLVADTVDSRQDWSGHFSVVAGHLIRMVPLP